MDDPFLEIALAFALVYVAIDLWSRAMDRRLRQREREQEFEETLEYEIAIGVELLEEDADRGITHPLPKERRKGAL